MSSVEARSKVTKESDGPEAPRRAPRDRNRAKPRIALGPILITLVTLAAAALLALGWLGSLYGRALDPRRHGARLCHDDGAGGGGQDRRISDRGQSVRA